MSGLGSFIRGDHELDLQAIYEEVSTPRRATGGKALTEQRAAPSRVVKDRDAILERTGARTPAPKGRTPGSLEEFNRLAGVALTESKEDWPKSLDAMVKLGDTVYGEFTAAYAAFKEAVISEDKEMIRKSHRKATAALYRLTSWASTLQSGSYDFLPRDDRGYGMVGY